MTQRPAFGNMASRQNSGSQQQNPQPPAEASAQQAVDAMRNAQQHPQTPAPNLHASPQQKAVSALSEVLKSQFKAIESIVPKGVDPQRLARIALIEFQRNPLLLQCNIQSVVGCVLQAAMLGLEIGGSLGYCYMIPYKTKSGVYIAQFQVGYKGLAKKALESGEVRHLDVGVVHQNDLYRFERGLDPKCTISFDLTRDRGPAIAYFACASFRGGGSRFEVMTKDDVIKFARAKSKSFGSGAWQTDFDAMAIKTVFKKLAKWLPMSESMERTLASDERVLTDKIDLDVGMVEVDANVVPEYGESETGEIK